MHARNLSLLVLILWLSNSFAQDKTQPLPRPRLVVGIVVDQMRWDYLYRYYNRYGKGGFKRLLKQGFSCENTHINYVPSLTAIGHTAIYTGSVPAIHGITGNEFITEATGKWSYCTGDDAVASVGGSAAAGRMSPRNLLVSTITDELRLATNFRSRVFGIALKDRGAILPAGHSANGAYWFDDATGNWITSTYYRKDLPDWVNRFNAEKFPASYMAADWNPLYPLDTYQQSSPDHSPYEGIFPGNTKPTFPVKTSGMLKNGFSGIRASPYGNSLTFQFAKAAVTSEKLGGGPDTDFLTVSLSSTDYVGHFSGANAIETEDIYLRLDRELEQFFTFLDQAVGKRKYLLFLTADHGGPHNPTFLNDHGIPAGVWRFDQKVKELNALLDSVYHVNDLVLSFANYQVHLNQSLIKSQRLDQARITADCIQFLNAQPGVAFAVAMREVATANLPQELKYLIQNGYNAARCGSIQFVLQPGWFMGIDKTGTQHGVWNPYDTHIPLLFMGWGIKHGATNASVNVTDIAATLAALLHIQAPNGCIGKPVIRIAP